MHSPNFLNIMPKLAILGCFSNEGYSRKFFVHFLVCIFVYRGGVYIVLVYCSCISFIFDGGRPSTYEGESERP